MNPLEKDWAKCVICNCCRPASELAAVAICPPSVVLLACADGRCERFREVSR